MQHTCFRDLKSEIRLAKGNFAVFQSKLLSRVILSLIDHIIDILTLIEFYRANHKIWFGVGLTFVLLPCFVFQVLFVRLRTQLIASPSNLAMKTAFCALRPFSVALTRLEFLKKLLFKLRWSRPGQLWKSWRCIHSHWVCCALWGSPWIHSTVYNSVVRR